MKKSLVVLVFIDLGQKTFSISWSRSMLSCDAESIIVMLLDQIGKVFPQTFKLWVKRGRLGKGKVQKKTLMCISFRSW